MKEENDVVAMEAAAKLLINQYQRGVEVEVCCEHCEQASPLRKQCLEVQKSDRDIIRMEMRTLYDVLYTQLLSLFMY